MSDHIKIDWTVADLRARIADLEAQLAERVKVKPLEWVELNEGKAFRALLPVIGSIRIEPYGVCGWWEVLWSMPGQCDKLIPDVFDTPDEAKAAAQADYERRILSALEATPPAPVQDTWFTDRALPVMAMSGDAEDSRVLKLHFRRKVTDDDRKAMCDALNLHQASLATPPAPKVTECATEGCAQTATVRFERGGVGSDYCHGCYMRIQSLTAAQEAGG